MALLPKTSSAAQIIPTAHALVPSLFGTIASLVRRCFAVTPSLCRLTGGSRGSMHRGRLPVTAALAAAVISCGIQTHAQSVNYTPAWVQQSPASMPQARYGEMTAYNSATGQVVLFGGSPIGLPTANDTWTYDGSTWTQQSPTVNPPARASGGMAYDAAAGVVVLFGGQGSSSDLNDTWTYNGTKWTQQNSATTPPARAFPSMTYDAATGLVVLFGGIDYSGNALGDTWTFNGTQWTQQNPASSPTARYGAMMTYNSASGQMVLFGGSAAAGSQNDTWTYNGTTWTHQSPGTSPPARSNGQMAYDIAAGQVVLFGGASSSVLSDTWVYNSTTWTQLVPPTSPSMSYEGAMEYDAATGKLVFFSGYSGSGTASLGKTWTYQPNPAANVGTANVCSGGAPTPCSQTLSLTFTFATGGTIKAPVVVAQGATGLDFSDAGTGSCTTNGTSYSYASNATCTVVVSFSPKAPGRRLGAVSLYSSGNSLLSRVLLSGTGVAPLGVYSTAAITSVATGLSTPRGLTVDSAGNAYVNENGGTTLDKFTPGGTEVQYTVPAGSTGTAVDGAGNIFYGNGSNVYEILAGSTASTLYASGVTGADNNMLVDTSGNLFITSQSNGDLYEVPASGSHTPFVVFPGGTAVSGGSTGRMIGTAIDGNNNVFLADFTNNRVYEVGAGSNLPVTVLTTYADMSSPHGLAVDAAGNLYLSNFSGSTNVVRFGAPFSGGIAANEQQLTGVTGQYGLSMGGDGTLYAIAGTAINKYVRTTGTPVAFAGTTAIGQTSSRVYGTFENDGNATLSLSSIAASNANFTAAGYVDGAFAACGTTVVSTGICGIGWTFTPSTTGPLSGSASVTDNSLNVSGATQSVALSGTAVAGSQTISFPQPATPVAAGNSATLTATGGASGNPVTFSITGGTGSAVLSGVNNSTITYTAAGTVLITASQAGNANYNAATPVVDTVTVTAAPRVYYPPQTTVGQTSATQTAYVTVVTAGTLGSIGVLTQGASGLDYAFVSGGTCTTSTAYTAGQVCSVLYTFTPKAPGTRLGAVQLYNGGTQLGVSLLNGTGSGPALAYPGNVQISGLGSFSTPDAAAVDAAGNVYVGEYYNLKEMVAVSGAITVNSQVKTLAPGYHATGVAVDGVGNVYFTEASSNALYEVPSVGGAPGSTVLISGAFSGPNGVAVDGSGNVYVADFSNQKVKKIAPLGGGTTVLSSSFAFGTPSGVAVDGAGNVYVSDYDNNAVYELLAVGGTTSSSSTVKQIGSGFNHPMAVALDPAGNVYVTEFSGAVVKVIVASGGSLSTASAVNSLGSGFANAFGVAVDGAGNVFVADGAHNQLKEIKVTVPPAIAFASTQAGTTSPDSPLSVQLENVGNAILSITSTTASTDFSVATAASSPCGNSLAAAAFCYEAASFTPATAGSKTGTLTLVDNATGSPQAFSLSGTATSIPQSLSFPQPATPVLAGTVATLSATGGASGNPVTFAITGGTGSATLSGTNNATITYTGTGTVQITASQAGNASYAASPPVTQTVTVYVPPSGASAPTTDVGSTSPTQTVTLTITTAGTLSTVRVVTQGASGLDYALVSGGTCSSTTAYTLGQTCTVQYSFAPKAPGRRLGAVTLLDASGTILSNLYLAGNGNGPLGVWTTAPGTVFATGLATPRGLTTDAAGNVYVNEQGGTTLDKFTPAGVKTQYTIPTGSGGIAVDGAGNIFYGNGNNVYEIAFGTTTSVVYASGIGSADNNLQVDSAGNLYLTNSSSGYLYKVPAASFPHTPFAVDAGDNAGGAAPGRVSATAIDANDNIYLQSLQYVETFEFSPSNGAFTLLVVDTTLQRNVAGLALDAAGNLYLTNSSGSPNLIRYSPPFGGGSAAHGRAVRFPEWQLWRRCCR